MRSPFGLLVDCVRLNAEKTELLGYDTRKIQFWLFVLAGGIAGLAGALFGHWANYLTPSVFSVQECLLVPIYVLVGGRGTLAGPFVGALLVGRDQENVHRSMRVRRRSAAPERDATWVRDRGAAVEAA